MLDLPRHSCRTATGSDTVGFKRDPACAACLRERACARELRLSSSADPIDELNALAQEYPELKAIAASIEKKHTEIRKNHEVLESTFARLGHVILKVDPATRTVTHANEAIEHVFGYTPDEIIGCSTRLLHIDEHSYAEFGRMSEDVLRRGETFETEYRMRRRDGSIFPAEISVRWIHAPDSWREGVVSVIHDVSQFKAQQHALTVSQEELTQTSRKFRALFDSALDAIALIDDEGRYIDLNPAAIALSGYSKEELVGRRLRELMTSKSAEGFARRWGVFIDRGWSTGEVELVRKDGQEFVVEFSSVANVLPGVHISINRDITDRKEYERRLETALHALRGADADCKGRCCAGAVRDRPGDSVRAPPERIADQL